MLWSSTHLINGRRDYLKQEAPNWKIEVEEERKVVPLVLLGPVFERLLKSFFLSTILSLSKKKKREGELQNIFGPQPPFLSKGHSHLILKKRGYLSISTENYHRQQLDFFPFPPPSTPSSPSLPKWLTYLLESTQQRRR